MPSIGKNNSKRISGSPHSGLASAGRAYKGGFENSKRSLSVVPIPANRDGTGPTRKAIREGIDMLEAKYL